MARPGQYLRPSLIEVLDLQTTERDPLASLVHPLHGRADLFLAVAGLGRDELGHRLAAAGDHDLLALGGALQQLREVRLGLVGANGMHGKSPTGRTTSLNAA